MLWCAPALLAASASALSGWPLPITGHHTRQLAEGRHASQHSAPVSVTYLQIPMHLSLACRHPASGQSTQVCSRASETEH